jgi:tetratricopeptide (TPR) repeat protein
LPEVASARVSTIHVDLQFLLDRRLYHQFPVDDVAPGFAESKHQPPLGSPLEDLIQAGHFRRAAETALTELLTGSSGDADRIFRLIYTRLACLVVISRPDLAADEAVPLTDFLNRNTPDAKDILPAVPWELRLLLVRLQSIAAADDGRRAVMSLYALSGEVRLHLSDAKADGDEASVHIWSDRLKDLGLRVADTLVEIGELETAVRHLDTLIGVDPDVLNSRKALLSIRMGDLTSARMSLEKVSPGLSKDIYSALLQTAGGDFSKAVDDWRVLVEQHPDNELLGQNLSACLLYTGRIIEARSILESIARETTVFPALLFNLSTVYELCTDRAIARKSGLSQHLAHRAPLASSGGWERTNADFKL